MSRRRPLPVATLGLVLATLAGYALEMAGGGLPVCERYGVTAAGLRSGDVLPLFAYPLLHDPDHVWHLLANVALLAVLGSTTERSLGGLRTVGVYVAGAVLGALGHVLLAPGAAPLVGASGAVFALAAVAAVVEPRLLAFVGVLFAVNLVALFHPSPWLVPATASLGCHVAGFTAGALLVALARARRAVHRREPALR